MFKSRRDKAERKAERKWRLKHLIAALVVIGVICVAGWGYVVYTQNRDGKAPTAAAESFLNAVETNSPAEAYLQLCAATKKQFSQSAFAAYIASQPKVLSHSATSVETNTVDGVKGAVVTEDIRNDSGADAKHSIVLTDEGGTWLVCGQPY